MQRKMIVFKCILLACSSLACGRAEGPSRRSNVQSAVPGSGPLSSAAQTKDAAILSSEALGVSSVSGSEPDSFSCQFQEFTLNVGKNGAGELRTSTSKNKIELEINQKQWIEQLSFLSNKTHLYLFLHLTNGDEGSARVCKLDLLSGKLSWVLDLPLLNLGHALLSQDRMYLSAMGFVGCVDATSGKIIWSHSNLYEPGKNTYTAFGPPELTKDAVVFTEKVIRSNRQPNILRFDRLTGK